jgi:hypothetical protein
MEIMGKSTAGKSKAQEQEIDFVFGLDDYAPLTRLTSPQGIPAGPEGSIAICSGLDGWF